MAWIESHQEVGRHPKTKKLARLLGVTIPAAVGHLHFLWWWALDFAQEGSLSKYDAADISDAMQWEGDADQLIDALVLSGYIDETDEGLVVHDWAEYAGKLLERRAKDRARKRAAAEAATHPDKFRESSNGKDKESDELRAYLPTNQPYNSTNNTEQTDHEEAADPIPFEKLRILWNETCLSYSKANGVNGNRRTLLAARWKVHADLDWGAKYFARIEASAFLKGKNDRKWKATLDWILNAANMDKILEGKYDEKEGGGQHGPDTDQRPAGDYTRGFKE
jgi:hypothetical protein